MYVEVEFDTAERYYGGCSRIKQGSEEPDMDEERNTFFEQVWEVVARIPPGKVATYGDIAAYVGTRSAARTVGWALNAAAGSGLPCHRVVNRFGALTGRRHFEGPHVMEERLRSEGVTFTEEGHVDLAKHRWVPGTSKGKGTSKGNKER